MGDSSPTNAVEFVRWLRATIAELDAAVKQPRPLGVYLGGPTLFPQWRSFWKLAERFSPLVVSAELHQQYPPNKLKHVRDWAAAMDWLAGQLSGSSMGNGGGDGGKPARDSTAIFKEAGPPLDDCSHSVDFRAVWWHGTEYSFTSNQAACVKLLWENWEKGAPDVGGDTLLVAADVSVNTRRFDHVFRDHSAWKTMIVQGKTKGSYRLADAPALAPSKKIRKPGRKKNSSAGAKRHV